MEFIDYDPEFGWMYIQEMCKKHKIKIHKEFYKQPRGTAWCSSRLIKIPYPKDVECFGICIHEIKHIFDGCDGETYMKEFECEMHTINFLKEMHYPYWQYQKHAGWYVLYHLSKKWNKHEFEIPMEIVLFFGDVNFEDWRRNRVHVSFDWKSEFGYKFYYTARYEYRKAR